MMNRLCRFRLKTLLLMIPLAAGGVAWWISWPNRTADRFAAAVASRDTEQLSHLCPGQIDVLGYLDLGVRFGDLDAQAVAKDRSLSDFLGRRGEFTLEVSFVLWGKPQVKAFDVYVDKGQVRLGPVSHSAHHFFIAAVDD